MPDDIVLDRAEAFVREQAATPELWRLLEPAFRDLRDRLHRHDIGSGGLTCVRLPLLVHAAITGDAEPAVPLAVALLLKHMGTELWDDMMDGEVPAVWDGYRASEVSLAAGALYAALTPLALATVDASPADALAMQVALARGLLRMIGGQGTDVALAGGATATAAAVEASVAGKSGEGVALCARLAALIAGASGPVVAAYTAMAQALGVAAQIRSDCADLFLAPTSSDLAAGTRTLPIALYLDRLEGTERDQFRVLLDRAGIDPATQKEVRDRLIRAGTVRACAVLVEVYCQRAREALPADAREPAAGALREMIESHSFFGGPRIAAATT